MFTPKIRQSIYLIGVIATSAVALLNTWHIIDPASAVGITTIVGAIGSLLGVGAVGTAAVVVGKQNKAGTFDEVSPVEQISKGVTAVVQASQDAAADVEKVKQVLSDGLGQTPIVGPLAKQVIDSIHLP